MSEHKHEHMTSDTLSVKLENSAAARNWIIRGVVIFLILVFFGGMALGANDLLTRDGTMPPETALDETITNPPEGAADIYEYLRGSISDAVERKPRLRLETRFDFGNDYIKTIEFTAPDAQAKALDRLAKEFAYLAPSLRGHLHTAILARDAEAAGSVLWDDAELGMTYPENPQDASPTRRTQYGEDFSKLLWSTQIDPAELESAECSFIYYRCTACGKGDSEPKEQCPECKAKGIPEQPIMVKSYRENYTLTLRFPDGSPVIDELFRLSAQEQALALLGDRLDGIATANEIQLALRNARIEAEVNRTTKELKALRFKRDIGVAMELTLDPAYSGAGKVSLAFTLGENTNFSFVWPGAALSARERTMKTRENSQLTVRYDSPWEHETPERTECLWSSSDESVCTVDQDGYLKSGKQTGEAVITVSFELNGQVYSDECAIHVKVPAENVKLDRRNLKLDVGGARQLTAKVTPRKATYQDVTWHSDNPEIAVVDENGLVTAVAPGKAEVYARAADGYFISRCFITVRGDAS